MNFEKASRIILSEDDVPFWEKIVDNTLPRLTHKKDKIGEFIHIFLLYAVFEEVVLYYEPREERLRYGFSGPLELTNELCFGDFFKELEDNFRSRNRNSLDVVETLKEAIYEYISDNFEEIKHAVGMYLVCTGHAEYKDFLRREIDFSDLVDFL